MVDRKALLRLLLFGYSKKKYTKEIWMHEESIRKRGIIRRIASKSWLEDCAKFKIIVPPKMRIRTTLVSLQNNFLKLFDFCFDFDGTIRFYD